MNNIFRMDVDHSLYNFVQEFFNLPFAEQPLLDNGMFQSIVWTQLKENVNIVFILESMREINNIWMV